MDIFGLAFILFYRNQYTFVFNNARLLKLELNSNDKGTDQNLWGTLADSKGGGKRMQISIILLSIIMIIIIMKTK